MATSVEDVGISINEAIPALGKSELQVLSTKDSSHEDVDIGIETPLSPPTASLDLEDVASAHTDNGLGTLLPEFSYDYLRTILRFCVAGVLLAVSLLNIFEVFDHCREKALQDWYSISPAIQSAGVSVALATLIFIVVPGRHLNISAIFFGIVALFKALTSSTALVLYTFSSIVSAALNLDVCELLTSFGPFKSCFERDDRNDFSVWRQLGGFIILRSLVGHLHVYKILLALAAVPYFGALLESLSAGELTTFGEALSDHTSLYFHHPFHYLIAALGFVWGEIVTLAPFWQLMIWSTVGETICLAWISVRDSYRQYLDSLVLSSTLSGCNAGWR